MIVQLLPWLYIGDCFSGSDQAALERLEVKTVVNLHSHNDPELDGVEQFQFRLTDGEGNSWRTVQKILDIIDEQRKVGNILVHCCGGMSRSPFIAVSYLAVKEDVDIDKALYTVAKKHPYLSIHPRLIDLLIENLTGNA
ncbi:MAG: dual specificity protein phosphatase family protein [Nitrososphaerales archaeon]